MLGRSAKYCRSISFMSAVDRVHPTHWEAKISDGPSRHVAFAAGAVANPGTHALHSGEHGRHALYRNVSCFVHHRRQAASPTATSSARAAHNYDAPSKPIPVLDSNVQKEEIGGGWGRRALFRLFSAISWPGFSPAQPHDVVSGAPESSQSAPENSCRPCFCLGSHPPVFLEGLL